MLRARLCAAQEIIAACADLRVARPTTGETG